MICVALRGFAYPNLELGTYTHKLDSLHVYERHFDTLHELVDQGPAGYYEIECPRIQSATEVYALIKYSEKMQNENFNVAHETLIKSSFFNWLRDNKYVGQRELDV
jgi:thymidylate synthase